MLDPPPIAGTAPLTVSMLERGQAAEAAAVLGASHAQYPAFAHLFPDRQRRQRILRSLFVATVRDAQPFGAVVTASMGGRMVGVAVWLPPGRFPWSTWRKLRAARMLAQVTWLAPHRIAAFAALGRNTERVFPEAPHWYLEVLGVRPAAQRLGVGGALLQPVLVHADRDSMPCHLETSDPANVAFYERFEFTSVGEHQLVPDGPPHYSMQRPARSSTKG